MACAILANVLIFYVTRIYGRRLAIERVLLKQKSRRIRRDDSFFDSNDEAEIALETPRAVGEISPPAHPTSSSLPGGINLVPPLLAVENENFSGVVNGSFDLPHTHHVPPLRFRSSPTVPTMTISSSPSPPVPNNESAATNNQIPFISSNDAMNYRDDESVMQTPRSALIQTPQSAIPTVEPTKKSDVVRIIILALLILALQFTALAIISLALVTPLTCLFFVWWRVATLETARRKIRKEMSHPGSYNILLYFASLRRTFTLRFWNIVLALVFANALVIVGGPHVMYVVAVEQVVVLDAALMIYITIVLLVILFQSMIYQSPQTMEFLAKCYGLKRTTDLEPLLLGANAGLLGGQSMLLIKLLANIAEAAFLLPQDLPSTETTFLIVMFAVVVGVFHVHAWRRGMGSTRTKLFIPVYRFWFVISGMIASLLFLKEFFASSPGMIATYFVGVFLDLAVVFVLARNALNAVKRDDFSTVIFLEEDPEHGIELHRGKRSPSSSYSSKPAATLSSSYQRRRKGKKRKEKNPVSQPPQFGRSISAPEPRVERAASADSILHSNRSLIDGRRDGRRTPRGSVLDNSEMFLSSVASPTHHHHHHHRDESIFGSRRSFQKESFDSSFSRRSFSREVRSSRHSFDDSIGSDGYESAGSFHSEPAESRMHEFHSEKIIEINYEYTSPVSMIVPKGTWNPWASKDHPFYYDCAAVPGIFKVRGQTYLEDGQKVKCDVSRMKLVMAEWLPNPLTPIRNICNDPSHFVQREHVGRKDRPFLFICK